MNVDYYLALTSPYTYMGHDRFEALAAKHGAQVRYRLVDVERVFSTAGTLPVKARPPQRQAYRMMELRRWRDRLGLPLNLEPAFFPADANPASRMVVAAMLEGTAPGPLIGACLRAVWVEERNLADTATLIAIAGACGMDGAALMEASGSEAVQAAIDENTEAAIAAGVFGMPTWKIGEELFWGQDRLDFLEEALTK